MGDDNQNSSGVLDTAMPNDYTPSEVNRPSDNRAPIEGLSSAVTSETPPANQPMPDAPNGASGMQGAQPPDSSASAISSNGITKPTSPVTEDQTPGDGRQSDAFLDQLLSSYDGKANVPNASQVDEPVAPPSEVSRDNVLPEIGENVGAPPTLPPPAETPVPPPSPHVAEAHFPTEKEAVGFQDQPNTAVADTTPASDSATVAPKQKNLVGLFIILALLVGGVIILYMQVFNKPNDLASSPLSGSDSDAVLTTQGTTIPPTASSTSNDLTRQTDLTNIQKALEQYFAANQKYPISPTAVSTADTSSTLSVLVPQYLSKLSTDPVGGTRNYTYISVDGGTYELKGVFDVAPTDVSNVQAVSGGFEITLSPGLTLTTTTVGDTVEASPSTTATP